ncbi:Cytochrome [Abeliophyllum distichum]|uniref:Cytochrome n=1 Tax=Abeliophyllum distichum TaxID=126358 RepID=A0ABD1RTV3_9LAMI
MFGTRTDTTSTALKWTFTERLRHPKTMKKLQNEVRQIAKNKLEITEDDLEKMPYLKVVIKESLRLHPPLPLLLTRKAMKDTKVLVYDIGVGTRVIINAWGISRDPMFWKILKILTQKVGEAAMAVDELALAKLMFHYNFAVPIGAMKKELDMSEHPGTTVYKRLPLLVIATTIHYSLSSF